MCRRALLMEESLSRTPHRASDAGTKSATGSQPIVFALPENPGLTGKRISDAGEHPLRRDAKPLCSDFSVSVLSELIARTGRSLAKTLSTSPASLSRARPERTRPSTSACAGGSTFSFPIRTRLSRLDVMIDVADQHDVIAREKLSEEMGSRTSAGARTRRWWTESGSPSAQSFSPPVRAAQKAARG